MGPVFRPRLSVIRGDPHDVAVKDTGSERLVIAHVLSSLDIGAHAQLASDLARAQRKSGDGVMVVCLESPRSSHMAADLRSLRIPMYLVPRRSTIDTSLPLRLARVLRRRRVNVVHTHDAVALPFGAVAGRLAGATVVHTERGDGGVTSWSAWVRIQASRFLDGLVSVSERGVQLANLWGMGGRTLLKCVAQAVDLETFRPDDGSREQVRRQLGLDDSTWVIGTVGHMTKPKDHALLLRAVAPLLGEGTSLLVVGSGPEQPALRSLAHQLEVSEHVRFPGARRDIPRMMAAMDTFALTSRDGDMPLVVPEAMATGLPVVVPDTGSIPRVVVDGETGWVVPPGDESALRDSLRNLRGSKDQARRMGLRARRVAQTRFSLERMNREYSSIYRSLVNASHHGSNFS